MPLCLRTERYGAAADDTGGAVTHSRPVASGGPSALERSVAEPTRRRIVRRTLIILTGLLALTAVLLPVTGQTRAGQTGAAPRAQAAVAAAAQPAAASAAAPDPAQATAAAQQPDSGQDPASQDDAADGRRLYFNSCMSCHGVDFNGVPGRGPSLRNVGGSAAVEFMVGTGRMPIAAPDDVPRRSPPRFTQEQIDALATYVGEQVGDTDIPTATPDESLLTRGRELYQENCAACHGVNGGGSAIGGGYDAPSLLPSEANTIAQAMDTGPGRMPVFRGATWTQEEVNAVATYVLTFEDGLAHGGLPIGGRGPVSEGFVAWIIGLGLLVLAARLLGTRTPKRPRGLVGADDHAEHHAEDHAEDHAAAGHTDQQPPAAPTTPHGRNLGADQGDHA